MLQNKLRQHTL